MQLLLFAFLGLCPKPEYPPHPARILDLDQLIELLNFWVSMDFRHFDHVNSGHSPFGLRTTYQLYQKEKGRVPPEQNGCLIAFSFGSDQLRIGTWETQDNKVGEGDSLPSLSIVLINLPSLDQVSLLL